MKRNILAIIAVFVAWSVMDIIIHGFLLMPTYMETKELWRPEAEMKPGLMHLVTLVAAIGFVLIYNCFKEQSIKMGLLYGLILGIAWGFSMGFGSYSYSPIPLFLAYAWFLATVAELLVAGLLVGWIVKPQLME